MKTLTQIDRPFHLLSYRAQIAAVQSSICEICGTGEKPLDEQSVSKDEFRDVFHLSTPMNIGAFAATFFEGRYGWRRYIHPMITEQDRERFVRAQENRLWLKYVGLTQHDAHLMGQIVHCINLIGEAWFNPKDSMTSASFGNYLPAYMTGLGSKDIRRLLVIGAFSPKSVSDIWTIAKYISRDCSVEIIDIQGGLSEFTAAHYGIPFIKGDGLASPYDSNTFDGIITNKLVTWFGDESWDFEDFDAVRLKLFKEALRLLKPGGRIAFVEEPLMDENFNLSEELSRSLDASRLGQTAAKAGFGDIAVSEAKRFLNRRLTDNFLKERKTFRNNDLTVGTSSSILHLIAATK